MPRACSARPIERPKRANTPSALSRCAGASIHSSKSSAVSSASHSSLGAPEHVSLVPRLVAVDRGGALRELVLVQSARHAAGHHVGGVRPLAAEGDDDRQDPLRVLDRLARQATLERRLEQLDAPCSDSG